MSFDLLNAEVDVQVLSLRGHAFARWWTHFGGTWRWVDGCEHCGRKYEGWWQMEQICLGALGELMLAGEKIPPRWRANFEARRRLGRRAWKTKTKH